jgi:soluble lytic murein transglycosylase-like protein
MIVKLRASHVLFACAISASSAHAQGVMSEDRYPNPFQFQNLATSPGHATSRRMKHRHLHARDAAGGFSDAGETLSSTDRTGASERKSSYAALIAATAAAHGVPVELANAVVRVESNYNPNITGRAGEIGLMQIKYQTARGLGYTGTRAALYDPATNLEWGMRYLAGAHKLAGGSLCGTLAKYQGGHGMRGSHTSGNYCGRVRTVMAGRGA